MRRLGIFTIALCVTVIATSNKQAKASEDAPEFCQSFNTAEDYKGIPSIRWDRLFLPCVRHTIGDGASVDQAIFDIVYRTALQHQNGIRDDREKALDYYEILLRDRNRNWRKLVSRRVDEYAAGLTSLGYPYRSNTQVLADIQQKTEEWKREVSGRRQISVGDTGTIEIPEDLSIGRKFVTIIGVAIIHDIARGLAGESAPGADVRGKIQQEFRQAELERLQAEIALDQSNAFGTVGSW